MQDFRVVFKANKLMSKKHRVQRQKRYTPKWESTGTREFKKEEQAFTFVESRFSL